MILTRCGRLAGAMVFACSGVAMAAEEHAAKPGLFTGDLGNIIWTLVTFLAVVFVLGKFAWRPILSGLQRREDFIRKSLEDADQANRKAERLLRDYEEQLNRARSEASAIVDEGRRDAEVARRKIQEETRKETDDMVARAKREIGIARDSALRDLYTLSANLATDVAGRILVRELKPADHQRLIEESLADLAKGESMQN